VGVSSKRNVHQRGSRREYAPQEEGGKTLRQSSGENEVNKKVIYALK